MEHKAYKRIVGDADVAVLFIHGIVGTPNHFNRFIPLVPQNVSVYNLLLDGHGKGVGDFAKTSMEKWERQVTSTVEELSATHEKIYIVGHSLGTLLAMEQAVRNRKVCKLFLLAVPLRLRLKSKMVSNALKVFFDKIRPDDHEAVAAKDCYGIAKDKNPSHYFGWIPRFLELFSKIRQVRKITSKIRVPCAVYQSGNDEMVSRRSTECLEDNPYFSVRELLNSGHYYYDQEDLAFLLAEFRKLFE